MKILFNTLMFALSVRAVFLRAVMRSRRKIQQRQAGKIERRLILKWWRFDRAGNAHLSPKAGRLIRESRRRWQ